MKESTLLKYVTSNLLKIYESLIVKYDDVKESMSEDTYINWQNLLQAKLEVLKEVQDICVKRGRY